MVNRKIMLVLVVLGVVLVVAAGVVYVVFVLQNSKPKPPEITLPPSLGDWAEDYPHLADILNDPELGSAYKEFLVVYEEEGEEAALELARERGILIAEGGVEYIYLILILDTEDNAALKTQLEELGARVFSAHGDRMSVGVPVEMVRQQLATGEAGTVFEELTEIEHVVAVRLPELMIPDGSAIDGEGISVIDADAWHDAGITGEGLRVGILDLGFDNYERLLGEELPDKVTYMKFGIRRDGGEVVHGTACAEIVHEIAPEATLVLAEYGGDDASFGEAVDWLVEQDVDIISHSANGLLGPRDGSGWDAQFVDEVVMEHGILWVNSAGNEALAHYRGVFKDEDGDNFHDFAPGDKMMPIYSYTGDFVAVMLQWEDDWERPTQDYQLHIYDEEGNLLGSSLETQSGAFGQEPYEVMSGNPGGEVIYAVVEAYDIDEPVALDIFVIDGEVGIPTAQHSIGTPADARYSLSVGAVNWSNDSLAEYSSQGPTDDERLKPEISAPTGVSGASYGREEFHGTSAACPHVAGASALIWQAHPEFSCQQTVEFLEFSAVDLGPVGPDTGFGYGRLQLPEVSAASLEPPTGTPVVTAGPASTPGLAATFTPVPTQVEYTIPTQAVPSGRGTGAGTLALAGVLGLVVVGLGCGGVALLLVGLVGLFVIGRRGRRDRPIPPPIPSPGPPAPPQPLQPQIVRCQHCGAALRPGARFCRACGNPVASAPQPRHCRHCGAALREGGRFCPRCGQPVE